MEGVRIVGDHVEYPYPLDLALLPVDQTAWANPSNLSQAIGIEQIALAHDPVEGEILTFTGFAGQRTAVARPQNRQVGKFDIGIEKTVFIKDW